ncbi:IS1-like element transposase [Dyadobacter sp. NIV53]|uniref:IS1-like element transposase n=1 Tax=Dyadobacter sp. NIV53 TaxID=2861765 RepID=UPI001C881043
MNFHPKCIRPVGGYVTCCKCGSCTIRHGRSAQNKQRYYCKHCKSTRVENYSYTAQQPEINPNIISLTKEGCGIRSTARLLRISTTTVTSRIKKIASKLVQPTISIGKTYEVDELRTFVRKKII